MVWPTEFDSKLDEYDALDLPGQQMKAAHATTPLDHLLNLDYKAPAGCVRLTGIIVTIGKATNNIEMMEKLIKSGMNIALITLSFATREENIETIKMLRQAAKNVSVSAGRAYPLGIAVRLTGRKIRTGKIAESFGDSVELKVNEIVRLTTDETYKDRCSMYTVYIDFMHFAEQISKGNYVLLDNEAILLKVEIISTTTLTCVVERGGFLGSYKDVFVPNVVFEMANVTESDKKDIEMAVKHQVDIIVVSFVHSPESLNEISNILGEKGKKISLIASIQSSEGFKRFDDIIRVANGVMITRQELGTDILPKKLVIAQKNMIARANKANVPVCVYAQLLNSMRYHRLPLRSELLDISNCVIDGADVLVLGAETAVGLYPLEAVQALATACKEAESCIWTRQIFFDFVDKTAMPCDQANATALAAVLASQRLIAAAIVVVTTSGHSAHLVSKYKPRCPILAVTRYPVIARHLHLWRGVVPLIYEDTPDSDWQVDVEKRVFFCTKWAIGMGFVRIGDPVVVVSGWKQGSGFTNTMRIVYATTDSNQF